ncbi:MAG: 30S ribosomal protein S3 [Candidatus Phytoplasma pyri]|uniref:30S ribosomal protein S3 n=1 Tax=Candidatus Phytoplasma pyri TaxID=47566 RepID=UPI003983261E
MGQKSNPNGLRLGIIKSWDSKWFANFKKTPQFIHEDFCIRNFINKNYSKALISKIEIERSKKKDKEVIKINLHVVKTNIINGKDNESLKKITKQIEKITKKEVVFNVIEIKNPDKVAILVAKTMAEQLEQRFYFRRVQKMAIQKVLKTGVKGVKTLISGRLGGLEMARSEGYLEGRVPLNTFRADVEYAFTEAHTTYGSFGVKVWIFHGDVLPGETILDTRKPFVIKSNYAYKNNKKINNYKGDK